jgi:hypothetical protein
MHLSLHLEDGQLVGTTGIVGINAPRRNLANDHKSWPQMMAQLQPDKTFLLAFTLGSVMPLTL